MIELNIQYVHDKSKAPSPMALIEGYIRQTFHVDGIDNSQIMKIIEFDISLDTTERRNSTTIFFGYNQLTSINIKRIEKYDSTYLLIEGYIRSEFVKYLNESNIRSPAFEVVGYKNAPNNFYLKMT